MTPDTTSPSRRPGLSRGSTLLFAVAGGAAVGNLYWAQPILGTIAESFDISQSSAGLAITLTQIGYAIGVFLIVPLGDIVNRRLVIPGLMALSAVSLALTAVAPTFGILLGTLGLVGLTTVGGQLLTPLAGDLADDEQRGRVIGSVVSGLLSGILVSRAISGVIADELGWRAVYVFATALMLIASIGMYRLIPAIEPRAAVPYGRLLRSVVDSVVHERSVRVVMLIGAPLMGVFTLFWTGLTFLLAAEPFAFSATRIGLVGLVGAFGAVTVLRIGPLHDRGLSVQATGAGLILTLASLAVSAAGQTSITFVLISVALFSIGIQSVQVLAQTRMLTVDPSARSRLNTVWVVGNFIGGAAGASVAGSLFEAGGWTALTGTAAGLTLIPLGTWLVHRKGLLAQAQPAA